MAAWNELVSLNKGVVLGILTASVAGGIGLMSNIMKVHAGSSGGALCHTDGTQVVGWTDIAVSMAKPLTITYTSGLTSLALRATGGATAFNAFVTEDTGVRFESYESTSARIYDFRTYIGGDINSILISNTTGGWTFPINTTYTIGNVTTEAATILSIISGGTNSVTRIGLYPKGTGYAQIVNYTVGKTTYFSCSNASSADTDAGYYTSVGGWVFGYSPNSEQLHYFYGRRLYLSTESATASDSNTAIWYTRLGQSTNLGTVYANQITLIKSTSEDTGTVPITQYMTFVPNVGTIATRPLYAWYNYTTKMMELAANGTCSINCTSGYSLIVTKSNDAPAVKITGKAGDSNDFVLGTDTGATTAKRFNIYANNASTILFGTNQLGSCQLGISTSNDALTHIAYGSLFVGDVGAFSTVNYRNMGNTSGGFLLGNGRRDSYLYAGGYYNGSQWIAKQQNIGITYCTIYGPSAESSYCFTVNKFTDSTATDYTFAAGTSLVTSTELFAVYAEGSITVGSIVAAYRTYYGYSSSYRCMQIGPTISSTQSISLGCNPSTMATGGFNGDHIIIPYNISMIAANVAGNAFYGILRHDGTSLYIGGSNYSVPTATAIKITAATGAVWMGPAVGGVTNYLFGVTWIDNSGSSGGAAYLVLNAKTDAQPNLYFFENGGQKWRMYNDATNDRLYISDADESAGAYMPQNTAGWTGYSDIRLKRRDSIKPLVDCLATVCQIDPVYYLFKTDHEHATPRQGFIAQDVFKVFPYAVDIGCTVNCMWGITPTNFIPLLVGSTKELYRHLKNLESENIALRSRIETLERRLAA
jgi:hypothetical protein